MQCFYSDIYIEYYNFLHLARKKCCKIWGISGGKQFFKLWVGAEPKPYTLWEDEKVTLKYYVSCMKGGDLCESYGETLYFYQ